MLMEIRGVTKGRKAQALFAHFFTLKNTFILGALLAALGLGFFQFVVKEHPYLKFSGSWVPQGYFPPPSQTDEADKKGSPPTGDWSIQAFYYTIGAWPVRFDTRPVFFTLPYEKGPPTQFIGKIHARWEMPDILFTWEGPKTPRLLGKSLSQSSFISVKEVEACFSETGTLLSPSCYQTRQTILSRHKQEMEENLRRARAPIHWDLRWFEVDNPLLPLSERPRGIYFSGQTHGSLNQDLAEDRIILVLPNGIQQAFQLQRPVDARGDLAKALFETSIRTLRVFPRLDEGRLWAAKELKRVNLDWHANGIPHPQELAEIINRAQLRLLSKLSVDPASQDAYFHLGGTSGYLARSLHRSQRQMIQAVKALSKPGSTEIAPETIDYLLQESAAIAKPNTLSALSYFRDTDSNRTTASVSVKPDKQSVRIHELEKLAEEVKRY